MTHKVYVIQDGKTIAALSGEVRLQVVNEALAPEEGVDAHMNITLTTEGLIMDLVQDGEVESTSSTLWSDLAVPLV